jgi:acetyltransferase
MIASAPLDHYRQTLETTIADPNVDMIMVIYLPFMGLKDIDVAEAVMEIKAKHPEKPVIGVFMTKSEFFIKLAEKEVNMPFFMYSEEAADGLYRLDQQRRWMEKPEGKVPVYDNIDKAKPKELSKHQ